jgi:hypothetical protein
MPVPAQCTKCGTIFWSRAFNVSLAVGATLAGCKEPCIDPKCGGQAVVAEGIFNATQDEIEILSAPDVTRSMLVALKQKITEKKNTYSSLEELQLDITSIHPSFGKLIIDALKRPDIAISVVLTPIQIWISLAQNEPIRVENVFFGPTTIVERPLYHRGSPTQSSPPAPLPVTLHPGDPIRADGRICRYSLRVGRSRSAPAAAILRQGSALVYFLP